MKRNPTNSASLLVSILATWLGLSPAFGASTDSSGASTRKSPDWLKKAVVYEIFTRNFSKEGDFNAITGRLNRQRLPGASGVVFAVPADTGQITAVQTYWRDQGATGLQLAPGTGTEHIFGVFSRALDTTAPVITCSNTNKTVEQGASWSFDAPTATDRRPRTASWLRLSL